MKLSQYAEKTTPVNADLVPLTDSEDSNATKNVSWTNLKATLKTYFDTLYALLASTTDVLTGTNAAKSVTPDALAALWEKGSNITSSGTISVGEGGFFHVTGTTTITDIDPATDKAGRAFWLIFDGALTLTYHATNLILPSSANIVTAAGDAALFISEGSDAVRCVLYQKRSAKPIVPIDVDSGGTGATTASGARTGIGIVADVTIKVYRALISQSGTSNPVVEQVFENSLGGTVVWTRNSAGDYTGTLSGAFATSTMGNSGVVGIDGILWNVAKASSNTVTLSAWTGGDPTDLVGNMVGVEIFVYA